VEPALRIAAEISLFWWVHSHFGEAGVWYERLLAVGEKAPPHVRAKLLLGAGMFSWSMSDNQRARERFTEARQIARAIDAPRFAGWALAYLMMNEFYSLDFDAAQAYGEESVRVFQSSGDLLGLGFATYLQTAANFFDRWRNKEMTLEVGKGLMSKIEPMVAAAQQVGDLNLPGHLHELLGRIALDSGQIDQAGGHLSEAVRAFNTVGNQAVLARTLDHIALLATRSNQPAAAVGLLAATTALRQHIGVPAKPAEQLFFGEALDTTRKNLTPDGFDNAWAGGTRMTRDQAVQHARTIIHAVTG